MTTQHNIIAKNLKGSKFKNKKIYVEKKNKPQNKWFDM